MHGFGFSPHRGCARRGHWEHFRRFGGSFGHSEGIGGRGFFGGRKLGSQELQLVILALLEEHPRHGYEIIKALEETSKGFYTPSPGMVYPALTYLEEVGYATVEAEGSKKLYRITDAGLANLSENRELVDAMLAQLARIGNKMERVRQAFAGEESDDIGHRSVDEARRALRAALISKLNASPSAEELQRVAEVLKRATEELKRKK
ncbi:MAG TPA: PadR family transcriptional regulator [Casimicrobiaceae bacterium]|nr:PadR family transcriptional regulator [Casimicrobiaceae bacterium]